MKKCFIVICIVGYSLLSFAQTNKSIFPKSLTLSKKLFPEISETVLPPLNITQADLLDKADERDGALPKFSRSIYTNLNLKNSGTWTELPNGGRVWRIKIGSLGALALIPFYNQFYIPEGGTLHIYSPDRQESNGAFTAINNPATGYYCTGMIHGDECIIEYYEPKEATGQGRISINEVGYAYRWIEPLHKSTTDFGTSQSCEVNVNCSEGAAWQDQKRSVARILVQTSSGQGFCSGALINNVREDCTPYLLSAQHCSEGTTANQFSQWVFYFNYEAPGCTTPSSEGTLASHVVIGCTKVADSDDNGGATGSDFLLLQLNNQPAANLNVFYSGWNTTSTAPSSGVCIHHPDGDIKKISTYTTAPASVSWSGNVQNTHWQVYWAATTNGHGVTEPGSSGSPLFNSQGQIVGKLTGGDSYCQTPNEADLFGKVAYDWTSDGTAANRQLKPWLDPDNSGATSIGGANFPCGVLQNNDAGIQTITSPQGSSCNDSITPIVVLKNFGGNYLTSVTINYTIDGHSYSYNWSGTLGALSFTNITLPTEILGAGSHSFSVATTLPNGTNDTNTANDMVSSSFVITSTSGSLNLYLKTDTYGSETSWQITNSSSQVVASGGPYSDNFQGVIYNIPLCLSPGCYTLTLYDSYGDGMSGNVNGAMTLSGQNGSPVYATLTDPNFGYQKDFAFCVQGTTGIGESSSLSARLIPNPSDGEFEIRFGTDGVKKLVVYNELSQQVWSGNITGQTANLNLSHLSKGIYILHIETEQGTGTQKLIIR